MEKVMGFVASNNQSYKVRVVQKGDRFGRNHVLTHDKADPMVEFYLSNEGTDRDDYFISRYYLSTFRDIPYRQGLCLDGGQREFDLDKFDIAFVKAWLYSELRI